MIGKEVKEYGKMAFDGIVIANIVKDMKDCLLGGRIYKIYQPEPDEINL